MTPSQGPSAVDFCAYVFGPSWEDIEYFRNVEDALDVMQRMDRQRKKDFDPFVVGYHTTTTKTTMIEGNVWDIVRRAGDGDHTGGGMIRQRTADQVWGT